MRSYSSELLFVDTDTSSCRPAGQIQAVEKFKKAALQMLGRLGQDASKASRRDAWVRFANMVEDITDRRVGWLSDLMVGSIITDYDDRLGEYCPTHTCSAMSFVFGMYK